MQIVRYSIPQQALKIFKPGLCFGLAILEKRQMQLDFWGYLFYSTAEEHKSNKVNVAGFFAKDYPDEVIIDITDDLINLPWVLNHTQKLNKHATLLRHQVGVEEDRFLPGKKTVRLFYSLPTIGRES
jgi:hypothetical protein